MITCTENPKDDAKKLSELIHESGKVLRHKAKIQKSVVFIYT